MKPFSPFFLKANNNLHVKHKAKYGKQKCVDELMKDFYLWFIRKLFQTRKMYRKVEVFKLHSFLYRRIWINWSLVVVVCASVVDMIKNNKTHG